MKNIIPILDMPPEERIQHAQARLDLFIEELDEILESNDSSDKKLSDIKSSISLEKMINFIDPLVEEEKIGA